LVVVVVDVILVGVQMLYSAWADILLSSNAHASIAATFCRPGALASMERLCAEQATPVADAAFLEVTCNVQATGLAEGALKQAGDSAERRPCQVPLDV
jgi:hypothetical protein